jgi:hypothetical protein
VFKEMQSAVMALQKQTPEETLRQSRRNKVRGLTNQRQSARVPGAQEKQILRAELRVNVAAKLLPMLRALQ